MFLFFLLIYNNMYMFFFFFSSRRRHTRSLRDWSSDVCSSDHQRDCGRRERSWARSLGPDRHRHAQRHADAVRRLGAGAPEPPRPPILQPVAALQAQREPGDWAPLHAGAETPQRRKGLFARVGRETEVHARDEVRTDRSTTAKRGQLPPPAVKR